MSFHAQIGERERKHRNTTMAKNDEKKAKMEAAAGGVANAGAVDGTQVKDDFAPEGWTEVSTSGAPIYKPETGVAEGKDLEGIAYDVIFALGGATDSEVWEAILFRATKETIAFKGEEQVVVQPGEDVLIPNSALLSEVARRAMDPRNGQYTKIRPTEQKEHASKKTWKFWDFRIAYGPKVDRIKENLHRLPERQDILDRLATFEAKLKAEGKQAIEQDKKILASYHQRLRTIAAETQGAPQLQA